MSIGLEGLDALRQKFKTLADKGVKKAAKAGVNAGLGVLAKEIRSAVNSSSMSPQEKAAVRRTVAKRLKKKEGQELVGKAGFGVGPKSKRKKEIAHARNVRGQGGGHDVRGVGISGANVHWLMGTADRRTSGEG
jgi:hypothetical protein